MSGPLSLTMTGTTQALVNSSALAFTILIYNAGSSPATNLYATANLPAGLVCGPTGMGVTCVNGVVHYSLASVGASAYAYFNYGAYAQNVGAYTNAVSVDYTYSGNNYVATASINSTVYPKPIWTITAPSSVNAGSSFDYTVTVTTPSGNPTMTSITFKYPKTGWTGFLITSYTNSPTQPWDSVSLSSGKITATESSLSSGSTISFSMRANVPSGTSSGNYAYPTTLSYKPFGTVIYEDIQYTPIVYVN